ELESLGDGFHRELALLRRLERGATVDRGEDALRLRFVPAVLLRDPVEAPADRAERLLHERGAGVHELNGEAGGREHLGDAVAHRAAADHGDLPDVCARGRRGLRRGCGHDTRSTASATALPPPRQSVARPVRLPRASSACSSVTSTRAPEAPIGWPSAT